MQWFESYLSSKRQVAKIDDVLSEKRYISCGVQQGNILGPILFLLYINAIKILSLIVCFYLFADHASTLLINKDIKEILKSLQ